MNTAVFIKHCMELYFNMTMPDPMQHATPQSSPPTKTRNVQNSPLEFQPQLSTRWRDMFEREWMPLQMCMSHFRNSSRSGWPSQHKWFTTWPIPCLRSAGRLLILDEDTPPTDVRVTQSQNTEWLNIFLDEKSVRIMKFDLDQLQNEIWWTCFLTEFLNNNATTLKQTKHTFLFLNSIVNHGKNQRGPEPVEFGRSFHTALHWKITQLWTQVLIDNSFT